MEKLKKQKYKIEKNGGITLIALVITIIVMLILAAISIAMLTGDNSILKRAVDAKERTERAEIIENAKMDVLAQITENKGEPPTAAQIKNILKKYFNADEVDNLEIDESLAEFTAELTTLNGKFKIKIADIYNGRIQPQAAGLYDATTGALKKTWEELVQENVIKVENGVVSAGSNSDRVNILTGKIIFPNEITEFANEVFKNCTGLTGSITIPDGLITIGHHAFDGCSGLTGNLIIPDSVTSIGIAAFINCSGFNGILKISNNVNKIQSETFSGCKNFIGNLVIPDSVTEIQDKSFYECSNFVGDLLITNNVTSIGWAAFYGCSKLDGRLIIPNSVTSLGEMSFNNCASKTKNGFKSMEIDVKNIAADTFVNVKSESLIIGNNVLTIAEGAFSSNNNLKGELIIGNSVKTIGDGAFISCSNLTGNLVIPNSVTTIGKSAFHGCKSFTGNLIIGNSVTTIGNAAFMNCSSLTGNLIIGKSVTTIGTAAFSGCNKLSGKIVIPNSVTSLGGGCFAGCGSETSKGLESIEIDMTTIPTPTSNSTNAFYNIKAQKLVLGNHVRTIAEKAFNPISGISGELIIPYNVTAISTWAFAGCSGLEKVIIQNSTATIGKDAFGGVADLYYSGSDTNAPWGANKLNGVAQ